MPEGGDIHIRA
ncbi:Protein of unknown function [Bacillus cereus]|nr:Protein of unknown function [Bacillus cereus]SCN29849.1 Protein of unknown function [Bacillus wiedmannii]